MIDGIVNFKEKREQAPSLPGIKAGVSRAIG